MRQRCGRPRGIPSRLRITGIRSGKYSLLQRLMVQRGKDSGPIDLPTSGLRVAARASVLVALTEREFGTRFVPTCSADAPGDRGTAKFLDSPDLRGGGTLLILDSQRDHDACNRSRGRHANHDVH